jgi:N-acyl-D-aspartate/D-glutamate deacylase
VTLREAVEAGVLGMTLHAARKARTRDPRFPGAAGRDGTAELYDLAALARWAGQRKE